MTDYYHNLLGTPHATMSYTRIIQQPTRDEPVAVCEFIPPPREKDIETKGAA